MTDNDRIERVMLKMIRLISKPIATIYGNAVKKDIKAPTKQ